MIKYVISLLAAVALGSSFWAYWQTSKVATLREKLDIVSAKLETCDARIRNREEAQGDVEEVNTWDGLGNVPPGWLVPDTGAGN